MECLACGKPLDPTMLLLTASGNRIEIDQPRQAEAVLCRTPECLRNARENHLLKAFFPHSNKKTYLDLARHMMKDRSRPANLIGLGVRSRAIVTGKTAVSEALKARKARLVILSTTYEGDTHAKISALASAIGVSCVEYREFRPLHQVVGRANCKCAAVLDNALATEILKTMNEYGF